MAQAIIQATLPLPTIKASLGVTEPGQTYRLTTLPLPVLTAALAVAGSRIISGHPIAIFDVPQVVNLTYPASLAFEGKMLNNYPLQRTDFRLVRGVTNEIVFFIRDIDRKPVKMSIGDTLTINVVDTATDTLLMSRNLTVVDLNKGIYQFTTLAAEMDTWPTGPLRWSMACNRASGGTILLWTDQNYSPFSALTITENPIPGPAPTVTLLWADFSLLTDGLYYSGSLIGAAQDGYTGGMQTFVTSMTNFIGTLRIDGSLITQPDPSASSADWFSVFSKNYTSFTGNDTLDVVGNYLWVRMAVTLTSGSLTQVSYKV